MGQIDPVLKNSTKHGNVPNSLLHDNQEHSPIKKNRRLTSGAQSNTNSDIRAAIFSPQRKVEYTDEVKFQRIINRTDKKSRAGAAGISSTSEGFFMVDGELVQLNHDGQIVNPVNPEMRMSKEIPISAVFQMHDKEDAAANNLNQMQNKLKLMRGFNKSQTKKNNREESLPKQTANTSYAGGARQGKTPKSGGKQGQPLKQHAKPIPGHPYGGNMDGHDCYGTRSAIGNSRPFVGNDDLEDILEHTGRDSRAAP